MPQCPHISPSLLPRMPAYFATSRVHLHMHSSSDYVTLSACTLRTQTCMHKLVTALFLALQQILGPLDHDDQCGKQKLAYKLEQVITLMSLDS